MAIRNRNGFWHYRFAVDGSEYTGSTHLEATARKRTAAEQFEKDARRKVLEGKGWELHLQALPFPDACQAFAKWAKGEMKAASVARIETSFTSARIFFGARPLHHLTPGMVEDYKVWRREMGVKEITLRHDLHALSGLMQFGMKHHWCRENVVRHVEIPGDREATRIYVISADEEAAYFAGAKRNKALYTAARLMLLQGFRPSELMALKREDVDLKARTVVIREGKTSSARRVLPLVEESVELLRAQLARHKRDWVFPGRGHAGPQKSVIRAHDALLLRLNMAFVLYDFRHTFATRAAAAGVPITSLAKILGHVDLRCVMRYVHPTAADLRSAMDLLDGGHRDD